MVMHEGRNEQEQRVKLSRRSLLTAAAAAGGGLALTACGGAAAPSPSAAAVATATLPPATPAPATTAPTTAAPATAAPVATVNVVAKNFAFELDKLVVPAGNVRFAFTNAGTLTHDFWIYPPQDLTAYLAKKRAGEKVKGRDYLKGASELFDLEAGKSGEKDYEVTPGYYELACFVQSKEADGSTFVHIDKGQTLWLTVTGPGFPPAATTPASTIAVEMKGEEEGPWLFVPDKLVVPAGDVTFKVTNGMKQEHEFVVHQLGDVSMFVAALMKGGRPHGMVHEMLEPLKGQELIEGLPAGKTAEKTTKLTPGSWVAACYLVGKRPDGTSFLHSDRGQRFAFTVR